MVYVLLALLVASTVSLDLAEASGCGSLLPKFSASSGTPGYPTIDGSPWIPTVKDNEQTLTVDLGQEASISKVLFAGDPSKPDTTNQIRLFYSNDGSTWHCISNRRPSHCKPFYSHNPPPVPGSDINVVELPNVVKARYFRFQPLEPSPQYRDGASSLRVDVIGCRDSAKACGSLLPKFSASSGTPGYPTIDGSPWIPTVKDNEQTLTVDFGQETSVSKVRFAGDPSKPDTTNQIRLFYSNDGSTWHCISNGSPTHCKPFYSHNPPPVPGSDINVVTLPTVVKARYFRFKPLEPSPQYRDGASSLRVDVIGCSE